MAGATENFYDYIIIGAGSAGCVLANRLSAGGDRVLLLEAGGSDRNLFIRMPSALSYPMNDRRFNWFFRSEPEPGADGRRFDCPRGKVLGGSSSINGMVYVRGHACDFDEWETAGADGWAYRHCLPYFRRAESWVGGADDYRGDNGPLATCAGNGMALNPLYEAFIRAGVEAGYPHTPDYNGYRQEGFGPMHMTVRGGVRESAASAYLRPAMGRRNLRVVTSAMTEKIVLQDGAATGVRYRRGGRPETARCRKEVLLSAGAIGSPALLQLSGIGQHDVLQEAGVSTERERPGVGRNLQDHLEVYFQHECTQPITLNSQLGLLAKARIGARWLLFRDGLGATNHFESCAFIRSAAGLKWPDIQYHFLPAAMRYDGRAALDGHGFQVHVGPNKPRSRGMVRIRSGDANEPPAIRFNYLRHPEDVERWRRCIRLTREILAQPALDPYRGREVQPGAGVDTDDAIDAWVRAHVESAYHPCGTCRMGAADDPYAVVDPECKVIGVDGLRVVDASVFPTAPNGNINAPTIMLAERASDLILGRAPLPPADVPVGIDEGWQYRQRPNAPLRSVPSEN